MCIPSLLLDITTTSGQDTEKQLNKTEAKPHTEREGRGVHPSEEAVKSLCRAVFLGLC